MLKKDKLNVNTGNNRLLAHIRQVLSICSAGVLVATPVQFAHAETAAAADGLEEVIVTARKRSETLQDVSSSIRAFSGDELERLGADSIQDYAALTPGLQLTGTANNTQLVIRGVTTGPVNHDQSGIKETVGMYLDETPIAVQRFSPNLKLYDLERIEVLRGPQGTLYGAGSMSGAVRMITRKADPTQFDASALVAANTISGGAAGYSFDGMVNFPLIDDVLAVRAVAFHRKDGGYIDNVVSGEDDFNELKASGGRVAATFVASDNLTIEGMVFYQDQKLGGAAYFSPEAGDLKSTLDGNEPSEDRSTVATLTANYQMDFADLTVSAGRLQKSMTYRFDNGTFTNFVTGFNDGLGGIFINKARQRNTSLEVRLASKPSSAIEWTVGAFLQKGKNFYGQDFTVPTVDSVAGFDSTDFGANVDQLYFSAISHDEDQYALFGEVVFPIGDAWKLTLGGRYFKSKQESTIDFRGIFAFPAIGVEGFRNSENGFNPKANISYQITPDHSVYAQAAKGFRLGGTNEPVPLPLCQQSLTDAGLAVAPEGYKSDSLWNFELGAKTQWLDRRLTINAAIYKVKWNDPQVTRQLPCGFNVFTNAGGLDIYGGEIEVAAKIGNGFTVRANIGLTDSKLAEDLTFLNAREGDTAPFTAKNTFSGSLDYRTTFGESTEGFGLLVYSYRSSRQTKFNPAASDSWELGGYGTLDLRLGVNFEKLSVELYGENLANKRGQSNRRFNPFHLVPATDLTVIQPRTIGIRLGIKY